MYIWALLLSTGLFASQPASQPLFPSASTAWRSTRPDTAVLAEEAHRLIRSGRYLSALPLYEQLTRMAPANTQHHRKLQNCLMSLDRKNQAVRLYLQRARAHPEEARNWYLLGRLADEPEKQQRYFETAIRIDPQYPWGYYGLGVHWGMDEQYLKGGKLLRQALELGIDEPWAYYLLGVYCQELGWKRQALEAYRRFLRWQPDCAERPLIVNRMRWMRGDYSALLAYLLLALLPTALWLLYVRRWSVPCPPSWTALVALAAAGTLLSAYLLTDWFYSLVGPLMADFVGLHPLPYRIAKHFFFVGPVEEIAKWIAVFVFAYRTRWINTPLEGMLCATATAIGFALEENVNYMWMQGWQCIINRGIICVPIHMASSAVWGYGLGRARMIADGRLKVLLIALSLCLGVTVHGLYNAAISFHRWEQASELTFGAGLGVLIVTGFLLWRVRHHTRTARLWSPYFRKSLELKRLVARYLDADSLHRALDLRPNSRKARRYWSAAVNLVTRDALERLRRQLNREQASALREILDSPQTSSRDVLRFWHDLVPVETMVGEVCLNWEEKLGRQATWRQRRISRKSRLQIEREMKFENSRPCPVRRFKEYPAISAHI